jgi:hypothetical protein
MVGRKELSILVRRYRHTAQQLTNFQIAKPIA